MESTSEATALIGLGAVFTLLFVTLGPLKVLGPFAQLTRGGRRNDAADRRPLVRTRTDRGSGRWIRRSRTAHELECPGFRRAALGGIIFALVGLNVVLEQYQPAHAPPPLPAAHMAAAMRITFPIVVTPYGIAALIVVLANSPDAARTARVLAILLGVMVLNLLAMLYARRIMGGVTVMILQILGAVLGVLQIALAIEMILRRATRR